MTKNGIIVMKLADDKKLGHTVVTLEIGNDIIHKEQGDFGWSNRNGMVFNMQDHILAN